jgi:hypothetical protein
MPTSAASAQAVAGFDAAHAGHIDVEQHQIIAAGIENTDGLFTFVGLFDRRVGAGRCVDYFFIERAGKL